jgi:hypothetical protein
MPPGKKRCCLNGEQKAKRVYTILRFKAKKKAEVFVHTGSMFVATTPDTLESRGPKKKMRRTLLAVD